ncbi:hypothetical protein, partial [Veronia pacifica]|uniref:hypothetical protein n=1 Tax=Veronia pacifica TaxID=1080227 RepID=UPI001585DA8E
LSSTGGGWNKQANSKRMSEYGFTDHYRLNMTVNETASSMIGLARSESTASYTDIDYALYVSYTNLYIYENGRSIGRVSALAKGDVLSIEVNNGSVKYLRNGDVVRETSYSGDTPDFYIDSSFAGTFKASNIEIESLDGHGGGLEIAGGAGDDTLV